MINDNQALLDKIKSELKLFTDVAIVGLSGGADSTLIACLCAEALGPANVYGIHMPYGDIDNAIFNSRSRALADRLKIKSIDAPVTSIADAITATTTLALGDVISTVNAGNARSRARMTILYSMSHHISDALNKRVRVIGTGNLSEDFIGYDTKGGDALADIFPVGELLKSEVYQLLEHFRDAGVIDEKHIDRVPSAGLWDGQTDEAELGMSYAVMEPVVKKLSELNSDSHYNMITGVSLNEIAERFGFDLAVVKFVYTRYIQNKHKHEAPQVIKLRKHCG